MDATQRKMIEWFCKPSTERIGVFGKSTVLENAEKQGRNRVF